MASLYQFLDCYLQFETFFGIMPVIFVILIVFISAPSLEWIPYLWWVFDEILVFGCDHDFMDWSGQGRKSKELLLLATPSLVFPWPLSSIFLKEVLFSLLPL